MSQPSVTTTHGTVTGVRNRLTECFLGIPYAAAPIGELRWKAPQPASDWTGVRHATQFGPACMQPRAPRAPESCLVDRPMSEDCLTLNIWRPAQREDGLLPVMVWFHGGAFRIGGTSLEQYDGSSLAGHGVLVVTVNYRLGIFGVFPHPALGEPCANFGLLDQIAALGWVQRNVAAFGGDPDNVTAFGESAGGASVAYLTAAPAARGLFAKAIIQSGALDLPEASRNAVEEQITAAVQALPVPHATAEELRSVPAAMLLQMALPRSLTMPYIDGAVVPMKMTEAFRQGAFARVPMLIGSNSFEAGFFGPAWYGAVPQKMGELWEQARTLTDGYGTGNDELRAAQIGTDRFATMNTRIIARAAAGHRVPVFRYYFCYVSALQRTTLPGAIHTAEIPYVFGTLTGDGKINPEEFSVSQKIQSRWIAFACNSSPSPPGTLTWPQYSPEEETILCIGNSGEQLISEPRPALLDLLEQADSFQMN
jgi:para-nitrobenzyl esterase